MRTLWSGTGLLGHRSCMRQRTFDVQSIERWERNALDIAFYGEVDRLIPCQEVRARAMESTALMAADRKGMRLPPDSNTFLRGSCRKARGAARLGES